MVSKETVPRQHSVLDEAGDDLDGRDHDHHRPKQQRTTSSLNKGWEAEDPNRLKVLNR